VTKKYYQNRYKIVTKKYYQNIVKAGHQINKFQVMHSLYRASIYTLV